MKILRITTWILLSTLLLASITLWIRSHSHLDTLTRRVPPNDDYSLRLSQGTLRLFHYTTTFRMTSPALWDYQTQTVSDADWQFHRFTHDADHRWSAFVLTGGNGNAIFPVGTIRIIIPRPYWYIDLPLWAPTTVSAAAMAAMFARAHLRNRRSRKRTANNLCPTCRYDLRAHLHGRAGDKCPECGTPVQSIVPTQTPLSQPPGQAKERPRAKGGSR